MEYSISEHPLKLREFGRNIQSMVEYAKTIEDKEMRTRIAHEIIRIMGNLNPSLRENPDYKQKLWDAIHVIGDYSLDIESPFPVPLRPEEEAPKERMGYFRLKPRYRQYGVNVQLMIEKALEMEDGEFKSAYLNLIANTMKQFLRNMDRETTPESVIAEHMRDLSKGRLVVSGEDLTINKAPVNYHNNNGKSNRNKNNNRRGSKNNNKNYGRGRKNGRRK
ncbi:MAG: DUF4290 domain-containing protein [Bacteroidia bacterium]|nr:DUF4290 domain-containing protein [Bacteroidia bacterium]